jgi:hypothetical protein
VGRTSSHLSDPTTTSSHLGDHAATSSHLGSGCPAAPSARGPFSSPAQIRRARVIAPLPLSPPPLRKQRRVRPTAACGFGPDPARGTPRPPPPYLAWRAVCVGCWLRRCLGARQGVLWSEPAFLSPISSSIAAATLSIRAGRLLHRHHHLLHSLGAREATVREGCTTWFVCCWRVHYCFPLSLSLETTVCRCRSVLLLQTVQGRDQVQFEVWSEPARTRHLPRQIVLQVETLSGVWSTGYRPYLLSKSWLYKPS